MLAALLVFFLLSYGLACLVADAKIFGCPAKSFYDAPDDVQYIHDHSVLPIRQVVMRLFPDTWFSRWVKLLLTCYLCLGVWCGATIHLFLTWLSRQDPSITLLNSYPLLGVTFSGILAGTVLAAVAGGVACYVLDLLVRMLENKTSLQERVLKQDERGRTDEALLEVVDRDGQ